MPLVYLASALVLVLAGLLFIVTSMLAMGMSLTMTQILQPLKNARLVALALLANFVLVLLEKGTDSHPSTTYQPGVSPG